MVIVHRYVELPEGSGVEWSIRTNNGRKFTRLWKMAIEIVDLSIENGDFPYLC